MHCCGAPLVGFRLISLCLVIFVFGRSPGNGFFISLAPEYGAGVATQRPAAGAMHPRSLLFRGVNRKLESSIWGEQLSEY
jgi:hypothetical protein